MNALKHIFWSPTEIRLRALWRLILHTILIAAVLLAAAVWFPPIEGSAWAGAYEVYLVFALPVAAIVAVTLFAARFLDRRSLSDLGLQFTPAWWRDLGFGLFLGAFLMLLIFVLELALGWITIEEFLSSSSMPFWTGILISFLLFLGVGIYEELLIRGYHMKNMAEGFSFSPGGKALGLILALLLSSALFGFLHAGNPHATVVSTLNLFLAGLFLGLPFALTDQLAIPIGIHITWNFFQGNVFGFPVSGTSTNETSFIAVHQGGPDLWTGGAFGPEAGILGNLAMLFGTMLILLWIRWTRGTVGLAYSVGEYQPPVRRETVPEEPS